ncbi:hypothetical protein TDB9533_00208 [Thalassocella blandensis]|nr:hypothetical protein TDB9533_00208 [Thalassocella blandensis]
MKYMLLVYGAEDAWTQQEREECMEESTELCRDLAKDGVFLGASPLHSVETATSVKIRESKRLITDGPFSETHEQLGGYYIVDVQSLDDAINIAARIPGATKGTVEIRPIVELPALADIPTGE